MVARPSEAPSRSFKVNYGRRNDFKEAQNHALFSHAQLAYFRTIFGYEKCC
jgi:hypothetical protein